MRDKISTEKQLTFKRGHQIGHLAQSIFPGGTDISLLTKTNAEAVEETKRRLAAGEKILYEAAFLHQGTLVLVDLLVHNGSGFDAYEVKSSIRVSETYIKDACLQYHVVSEQLPTLQDFFLVTLNADYRLENTLDLKQLFKRRSIKQRAEENKAYFAHRLSQATKLLEADVVPSVATGKHCFKPYQCDFFGHCWKHQQSADSIFEFPMVGREKLWEWYEAGITRIEQLSATEMPRVVLEKVLSSIRTQKSSVDKANVKHFLNQLQGSFVAMDIEAFSPPVPLLQGTGPFYQYPFLASFYDGSTSFSIFAEGVSPQNLELFAKQLVDTCRKYAHILVYDKNLERMVLQNLKVLYPAMAESLIKIEERLIDISDVFKNLHYYHPGFKGSFSLKTLMQVLMPEYSYDGIVSGLAAMDEYDQYLSEENPIHRELLKNRLTDYCEMDAKACFLLKGFLEKVLE